MRLIAITAAAALAATASFAQSTADSVNDLVIEQQGAAESFAMSNPAEGPAEYDSYTVMVGDMLPEGVILQDIPNNDLAYARLGGEQVIVNPADNMIISIVRVSEDG